MDSDPDGQATLADGRPWQAGHTDLAPRRPTRNDRNHLKEMSRLFDLASPGLPPALSTSFAQLENAYRRLTRLVEGMTDEAFAYTGPEPNANSTAMLVRHMILVDLEYLHTIMGKTLPKELEERYGPFEDEVGRIPQVVGMTGPQLVSEYRQVIDMAREYLTGVTDDEAERPVTIPWWPEPATVRYILWHMASHSMMHQGQIARLKASLAQEG